MCSKTACLSFFPDPKYIGSLVEAIVTSGNPACERPIMGLLSSVFFKAVCQNAVLLWSEVFFFVVGCSNCGTNQQDLAAAA